MSNENKRRSRPDVHERYEALHTQILDAFNDHPGATQEFVARLVGVSWATVQRHMKRHREGRAHDEHA